MELDSTGNGIQLEGTSDCFALRDVLGAVKENLSHRAQAQLKVMEVVCSSIDDSSLPAFEAVDFKMVFTDCANEVLEVLQNAADGPDKRVATKAAGLLELFGYNSRAGHL